jgi:hypothetical protein
MEVEWTFTPRADGTLNRITHAWRGPDRPIVGGYARERVIGPHFVSANATRTHAGVSAEAERRRATQSTGGSP